MRRVADLDHGDDIITIYTIAMDCGLIGRLCVRVIGHEG